MVQTVYHYFDSNSESRCYINATKHSEQNVSTKYHSSNISSEPSKLRSKKNHCIRLQPMNAKVENTRDVVYNANERKSLHKLNPPPNKPIDVATRKKLCSKIPVLKRKTVVCPNQKNNDVYWDASLSAADRRQKFHQSRLQAAGICTKSINGGSSKIAKQLTALNYDVFPKYESHLVENVKISSIHGVNQKTTLPPIKPVETIQKINQPKSKCLLGEITHFPTLCNPLCSRKKKFISAVPNLPPILPPPAAPPPSISTSLEKDGNQVKHYNMNNKQNEDWNYTSAFQKLLLV